MSGETQPRRRKDKKKKDTASDEGTGDEELKEHHSEGGGASCLTVLVFLILLSACCVLLGLIYVQSQSIAHVDTPEPPVAAPRVETVVETITEGGETPPPTDDQGGETPADQPESGDAPVEVVQQVIEEHIVYVDAPPGSQQQQQEQVVYVEAPQEPVGIQLEGSEPRLEEQFAAPPPPVPAAQEQLVEVKEGKVVRMRQVVKQITDADGTVREEIVSEEEVKDDAEEHAADRTSEPPSEQESKQQQQQRPEDAAAEVDEGVVMAEPADDSSPPQEQEGEAAAVDEAPVDEKEGAPVEVEEEAVTAETVQEAEEVPALEEVSETPVVVKEAPLVDEASVEVEEETVTIPIEEVVAETVTEAKQTPPQEVSEAELEVEEDATPQEEAFIPQEEEEVTEAVVEEESQEEEQQQEVATGAEPPAADSVPPTNSVPVDTNTQDSPAETPVTQEKPREAEKVEDKPKEPVEEQKPKEPIGEEKPREPVKEEKAKEPVKEEKSKEHVKEEKPKEPAKEEKPEEPAKEEKPEEPAKEEKPKEPVREEKPMEPVKEEKPKQPVEEEKPEETAKEDVKVDKPKETAETKVKEPVTKEKPSQPVKEEKLVKKPVEQTEPKPTEAPVKKEAPTEKPKEVVPTEKPVVKEAPIGKPAPKTTAKEAEEIERVRFGGKEPEKKPDPASRPAAGQKEPGARPDSPVERGTDKHAKQTAQKAAPTTDEGIVADIEDEVPSDAAEYDKADVTGPEDWDIRAELDAADNMVDTDDQAALRAFGAILSRRPRSPRALWGRARALDAQAMRERSNAALDKAIKAYRDVLDLDLETPLQSELFRRVAEQCVQQMRFRGNLEQAARIQQRMIQKFPDDYGLRNHLATVFMTYNQNKAAEEVLLEVLRRWPDNGYAKVHLGFIRRQEGKHEEATELMQAGLDSDEPGVHDKRFYFALGDSYDRIGKRDVALKIYEEGVSRGLLLSVLQRSLMNVDRLTGRPYWTAEQTGSQELIRELEANFRTIRGEMLSLLDSDRPEDGFEPENEQLSKTGDWKQYTMFRRGRKNQYACVKTPRTCEIIDKFPEASRCRRGQVKFSMLAPGTTVWPHTGPTNCRLRLHLGLKVPSGTGIRVAGEKRTWEEGKVLIFDDSFEHDVWNKGDAARFILIIDIWHPELTEEERRTLPAI